MFFFPIIDNALQPVVEQAVLPIDHNAFIALQDTEQGYSSFMSLNPSKGAVLSEIEEVFGNEMAPAAYQLALCESSLMQFKNGEVVMSDTGDAGLFQINLKTWLDKSRQMGLNILDSWTDNVKMAHYILFTQGWNAWTCRKVL